MNKKFNFITLFLLLLSLTFTPTAFASEKEILKPANNSIKVFDEISIEKINNLKSEENTNDDYIIVIEDEVNDDGINGFNVDINQEKGTYTVEKMTDEEIIKDLSQNKINLNNQYTTKASNKKSWLSVRVTTRDPPSANLNYTRNKLTWTHNGSKSNKSAVSRTCNAYAPTVYKTNWYTSSCKKSNYSIIDSGRTVTSKIIGSYYNYDFGNKKKITKASHNIYIEGYRNVKSKYTTTLKKSGEFNNLIKFRVV